MYKFSIPILTLIFLPLLAAQGFSQQCETGHNRPCGSNIGECREGMMVCENGNWSECYNNKGPLPEICQNNLDDDCDNVVDESGCIHQSLLMCRDGPIREDGCMCGSIFYRSGYCQDNKYIPEVPEFPWLVLTIFGVIILCVIAAYMIYAGSQDEKMYGGGKVEYA